MTINWSIGTGKVGDQYHQILQGERLPASAVISGFANGELMRNRFRTRSRMVSLLQTSYLHSTDVERLWLCAHRPKMEYSDSD